MTASEQMLDDGFAVLTAEQGRTFTCEGKTFVGLVASPLVADRGIPNGLAFGLEYDFEIGVARDVFGTAVPVPGNVFLSNGESFRIVGVNDPPGSRKVVFLVTQPARRK